MHIQISSICVENTKGGTSVSILSSYWLIQRRGGSYCLIPSLAHFCLALVTPWRRQVFSVALCAFKMCQELLHAHLKSTFMMKIEQLPYHY
jgi:hypothetical protein